MKLQDDIVAFTSSYTSIPDGAKYSGHVHPDDFISVSVYLKPKGFIDERHPREHITRLSREDLKTLRCDDHKDDIGVVCLFAVKSGLNVDLISAERRLVKLSGTAQKMQDAFCTKLSTFLTRDGLLFRGRSSHIYMPKKLSSIIEAVLGLDTRPAAAPHCLVQQSGGIEKVTAHRPNEIASLYQFPKDRSGSGQAIALIELGSGYTEIDNETAFAAMGLPTPKITNISINGATNMPGGPHDSEVALDIQVAGGTAPGAHLVLYFSTNTFQGFVDAISASIHDNNNRPSIVSISWGASETCWTEQARQTVNSALKDAMHLGISVFVAAGDHLATNNLLNGKANVSFPASSPFAIGCGGTQISTIDNKISKEVVWNEGPNGWGTGGGISDVEPIPFFQSACDLPASVNDGCHRRGVPDVAGNASSLSGYTTVIRGISKTVGGTSAVAPLWAGLTALINERSKREIGFFLPFIYANPHLLRSISQGNNRPSLSGLGYDASNGWNACTGLGSPNGIQIDKFFTDMLDAES